MFAKCFGLALSIILFSSAVDASQSYDQRFQDCMTKPPFWANTSSECERAANGETWAGMPNEGRAFAERSLKEIRAAAAKRAAAKAAKLKAEQVAADAPPPIPSPAPASQGRAVAGLILMALLALLYFIPGIVAQNRHHHQRAAIWLLNFFLGWTVLGWMAALIWASTATPGQEPV